MTATETDTAADGTEEATTPLRERVAAFPWPVGVLAGAGAFALGYVLTALLVGVRLVLGLAQIPPGNPLGDVLSVLGFAFYNAHGVPVVVSGPNVVSPPVSYLPPGVVGLLYRAVPVVVLVAAGGGLAAWRDTGRQDALAAVATGASVALGYLAVALVGTYVFTTAQTAGDATAVFHPDRLGTLLRLSVYPFVLGLITSIVAQTRQAGE